MENKYWENLIRLCFLVIFLLTSCQPKDPFPLSEQGPYQYGQLNLLKTDEQYIFADSNRQNRLVGITIWYPAFVDEGKSPSNAKPDDSGAPYPLILSSAKVGGIFGAHLASHGFVYIGINGQDSADHWGQWLLDYPHDVLFILNQISTSPLAGLEGMIDTDNAGSMGYSFDSITALTMGGARIDPEFYQTQCAIAATMNPKPEDWWVDYICNMDGGWDAFEANAGKAMTASTDGLWQAITDTRIKAVMPMAPEGAWLFGPRGLASLKVPALIVSAAEDDINYYALEAVPIFEQLGSKQKMMISFIDQGHMMIYDDEPVMKMTHLAAAFFGYYLQGKTDYQAYLTEKTINCTNTLTWGVYSK